MRIHEPIGFAKAVSERDLLKWSRDYAQDVGHYFRRVTRLLNGEVSFGNGVETSNLKGQWVTVASSNLGGTDTAIPHTLGVVPAGFILMIPPREGYIHNGTVPWTSTTIYLRCTADAQTFRIFLVAPPEAD